MARRGLSRWSRRDLYDDQGNIERKLLIIHDFYDPTQSSLYFPVFDTLGEDHQQRP
jgi:hypothetical protein